MQIEYKRVEEIFPYENNPRINDNAIEYVARSIHEFGFKVPIVIDKNNVIVTGHTRYKAAKYLGMNEVPVIYADDLNEEQVKAFRLADNKVSELATWDLSLLEDEIDSIDLDMEGFGFNLDTSYIDELLENDYGRQSPELEHFAVTFTFPIEVKEEVISYIKEIGKEVIVENMIKEAQNA